MLDLIVLVIYGSDDVVTMCDINVYRLHIKGTLCINTEVTQVYSVQLYKP